MKGLLAGLAGVAGLYALSRTQKGAAVVADLTDAALAKRGIRNNNPGNIDWIEDPKKRWDGMIRKETPAEGGRFGVFISAEKGVRAIGQELLLDDRRGLHTVQRLISSWAPSNENNTAAYVSAVSKAIAVEPDQAIDVRSYLPRLAKAIIKHENGQCPYSDTELQKWVLS